MKDAPGPGGPAVTRGVLWLGVLLCAFALLSGWANAQESANRHNQYPQPAAASETDALAADAPHRSDADNDPMVSLNFPPNVELRVLIEYVSDRLDLNILYDRQVGNQSITLRAPRQVPISSLYDLLQSILQMNGLLIVPAEQENWLRIVQSDNIQRLAGRAEPFDPDATRGPLEVLTIVFRLRHITAQEAERVIQPFLSQAGRNVLTLDRQRMLIITDHARNIERAADMLELADHPPETIETRFAIIEHHQSSHLHSQVMSLLQHKYRLQGEDFGNVLAITDNHRVNQLVVMGKPVNVAEALSLIQAMDVPSGLETRVYQLTSITADRLNHLTRDLLDPEHRDRIYRSAVDTEANLLIATTTQAVHEQIKAVQQRLDVDMADSDNPVQFYRLMRASAQDVLETLQALAAGQSLSEVGVASLPLDQPRDDAQPGHDVPASYGQSPRGPGLFDHVQAINTLRAGQATVVADTNTNSLIVVADSRTQRVYQRLIQMLDQRRPQVLIEVMIVALDTSNGYSLGVEVARRDEFSVGGREVDTLMFSAFGLSEVDPIAGRLTPTVGRGFSGAVLSPDIADVVIRALSTSSRARVVSSPRVLVNDNAEGSIHATAQQPYTSLNAFDTVATTSFGGYVEAGTTISVIPQIAEGDYLNLWFNIELSQFTQGGNPDLPSPRQTNEVQSIVTVPDGHTIIVGGINLKDFSESVESVPILGDIPLIKHLFSNRRHAVGESTLFVFIRPRILRDDQFQDLKLLSQHDAARAGLRTGQAPTSQPVMMR